jgi:hypothetical protein
MRGRFLTLTLLGLTACSRKTIHAPSTPDTSIDNAYLDLQPDSRLRIVLPLSKTDGTQTGFEIAHYAVTGHAGGRVGLQFMSAEITNDGKAIPQPHAPILPFSVPRRAKYIRLIYLRRLSRADHNMAVVAAHRMDILNSLTKQVRENPQSCHTAGEVLCSWVPPHVAVRPEK